MAKQVNSRMRQKCDTLANWGKAPNFTPLEGEIIIISDAFGTGYPGIKIGDDKKTLLSDLEYVHGEREIVSVTRNQEDTGYTVLLSNGENFTLFDGAKGDPGYTPQKGVDYFDGQPGASGTSVTITDINQNTTSGGVSTVTFSDGNSLSIYNGKDGASGEGGGDVDLPLQRGDVTNSLEGFSGDAKAEYAVAFGSNDKNAIIPIVGSALANAISVNNPTASGIGSIATGGGAESTSAGA
jgi:hypothetical protein